MRHREMAVSQYCDGASRRHISRKNQRSKSYTDPTLPGATDGLYDCHSHLCTVSSPPSISQDLCPVLFV